MYVSSKLQVKPLWSKLGGYYFHFTDKEREAEVMRFAQGHTAGKPAQCALSQVPFW